MKVIETHYAGYHFRSRLEARWAVFFDTMKIKWQYEPEGYVLENGEWYLPDFLLEDSLYAEVKPAEPTQEDWSKIKSFAQEMPIVLLIGIPDMCPYTVFGQTDDEQHYGRILADRDQGKISTFFDFDEEDIRLSIRNRRRACVAARSARFDGRK